MPQQEPPTREFAIRVSSIDGLFWQLDARPVADRTLSADVRWALLDEWERVRHGAPSHLTIYAPAADRADTDEDAVRAAIRRSLRSASGPLRRIDPLSRQEKVAAWIGVAFLVVAVVVSTLLDRVSEDVLIEGLSQGIVVVGWVAIWNPAQRFIVEVAPHVFNRRRFAEFANIDVRFVWG
jgi:type II secretory pathway component PulM